MTSLQPASLGVELLDDPAAAPERVCESLRNIARANRWLGGSAAVRFALSRLLAGRGLSGRSLTLLDVGTGLGDLPCMARHWAARRGVRLTPIGLERHAAAAQLAGREGVAALVGDGATLPFRDRSVDLVLLSQVAHHFAPSAIVRLFQECARVARVGLIVADLRRSTLAAVGFRIAGRLLRFDPDTVRDGVTSLARGFSRRSLAELLRSAGLESPVSRRPGSRLVAVWQPPG